MVTFSDRKTERMERAKGWGWVGKENENELKKTEITEGSFWV